MDIEEEEIDYNDFEEEEEEEDEGDDEYNIEIIKNNGLIRITDQNRNFLPRITSYEWARINETRALQIDNGSIVSIDVPPDMTDSLNISSTELRQGQCPLYIGRPLGNGTEMEIWHTNELAYIDVGLNKLEPTPVQSILTLSLDQIVNFGSSVPKLRAFSETHRKCNIEEKKEKKEEKKEERKEKKEEKKEKEEKKKIISSKIVPKMKKT